MTALESDFGPRHLEAAEQFMRDEATEGRTPPWDAVRRYALGHPARPRPDDRAGDDAGAYEADFGPKHLKLAEQYMREHPGCTGEEANAHARNCYPAGW